MEALVTAFVAAFLGEWGDKTQLIVAMLAAGTKRPLWPASMSRARSQSAR
jgi:putative Ca2+/H+ antiporter (TMEM165/GDT1 family)